MFANNMSKKLLTLSALLLASFSVSALPEGGQVVDVASHPLPFTVLSADVVTSLSVDVVAPLPFGHHSDPTVGVEPSSNLPVISSVGGSSLTVSEMKLVMGGGRNYDPKTRSWGYREPFIGEKRNTFMLSWEAHRRKSSVNDLIPLGMRYSK